MTFNVTCLDSIDQISADTWNNLCGYHYPFLRHEFLAALESSGCTSAKTGWQCAHLCIHQAQQLVAIMPMYKKTNSNGEYVFDWDWADAYARHQLAYYPKLVTAIPFSPCYGPRIASSLPLSDILPVIYQHIMELCQQHRYSSWHGLFHLPHESQALAKQSLLTRIGVQYHWRNEGFTSFEHYLEKFTSRKRKSIKRERRIVADQQVKLSCVEGPAIDEQLLTQFYYCYQLTYLKRGRQGYLNIAFFEQLLLSMANQIVLFVATHQNEVVACAWCFKNTDPKNSTLYGRYWGCLDNFDNLHFETCYYTGLEYCIEHKIQRFDPGAQGEHKIQRGFEPITTYSNHYIAHPQFSEAIEDFLIRETQAVEEYKNHLTQQLPFKQAPHPNSSDNTF